ncbi:HAD-IIIC family phosphatase [Nannocystis radixulma]|uniref:HAD-IIIC family phosphatase n=1 Tax=Nannocystis radixulma TaxID=2995305 RepID=A0ABT5BDB6_9BACT|nr:HAD-IIIC family phosphatase [Nannocystis radixulma]MDC0672154.1 HAD-IIIC family phosphatase [Nannocystis radixulma]
MQLTHCGSLRRLLVPADVYRQLHAAESFAEPPPSIASWIERLAQAGMLAPRDADELAAHFESLPAQDEARLAGAGAATADAAPEPPPLARAVHVGLIGGCTLQVLTGAIQSRWRARGVAATASYSWFHAESQLSALSDACDFFVLHLFIIQELSRLFAAFQTGERAAVEQEVQRLCARVRSAVEVAARGAKGRLCVVHTLCRASVSPWGVADGSYRRALDAINAVLYDVVDRFDNVLILDEDDLLAEYGRRGVLDHPYELFAHHGYAAAGFRNEMPPWGDPRAMTRFLELSADRYLDLFDAWSGHRRLKLVVVDLDNTLWPGVCGDEGFTWEDRETGWILHPYFAGLHEALRLLAARGVMLATCSKNDRAHVLGDWTGRAEPRRSGGPLHPDEFVTHSIDWDAKGERVRRMLALLGVAARDALFIDDNPVERAEVGSSVPGLEVFDGPMHEARSFLLSHPRLQFARVSAEARTRARSMRVHLERDALRPRAESEEEFLRGLEIKLHVTRASGADVPRAAELIARTNQFNTTHERIGRDTLEALAQGGKVWCMHASDRFMPYGLTGVIVLDEAGVRLYVMSCRVLGLRPELPFLSAVLRSAGWAERRPTAVVRECPRNEPCRSVFLRAGFRPVDADTWVLEHEAELYRADPGVYEVTVGHRVDGLRES